jgi:Ca-activated chloride channel family protein
LSVFAHPEWLGGLGLALGAVLLALGLALWRARQSARALLGRGHGAARSDLLLLAAALAVALALLAPRLGERRVWRPGGGVDVVFLVDVSRSMDTRDVPPSRLARARRTAQRLLERLAPGDRAGLAAFAERGVLLAPLTPDLAALSELLAGLDSDLIHPAGSHLGAGVRAALEAFAPGEPRPRILFVLGDGEDPEARRDLGGAAALRAGARVLVAALGSEAGGFVPDGDAVLRDPAGEPVRSRRHLGRLERLAAATGGEVFVGDAWGEIDLERALASLRRDAGSAAGEPSERRVPAFRVLPFAAAAFALLLLEVWPPPRRRRTAATAALAALALLAVAAGSGAPSPRWLLQVGAARLERGEDDAAARAFAAGAVYADDPALASLAYYDLGVAELSRGNLAAAREAFFDALALAPDDRRARFNLEWTLRELERQPPEEPQREATQPPPPSPTPASEPEGKEQGADTEQQHEEAEPPRRPDAEERRRLLSRVRDDPARALRAAAREPGRRRPAGPAW